MKLIVLLLLTMSCTKVLDTKDYIIVDGWIEIQCEYHEENNEYSECVVASNGLKVDSVKAISGIVITLPNND